MNENQLRELLKNALPLRTPPTRFPVVQRRAMRLKIQRYGLVGFLALLIIGAVAIPASVLLPIRRPPPSGVSTEPFPRGGSSDQPQLGEFVPVTRNEGDNVVLPITFPDGSSTELVYPRRLDLVSLGITSANISASLQTGAGTCGSEFSIWNGNPHSVIYEGSEPVATYAGAAGSRVDLWRGMDGSAYQLVYRFDPWVVTLPCDSQDADEGHGPELWARSLSGHLGQEGFLLLQGHYPLRLFGSRENGVSLVIGRFGSPDEVVILSPGNCISETNGEPVEKDTAANTFPGGVTRCMSNALMQITAYGDERFTTSVIEDLVVRSTLLAS
jgi:hypothetical protein